MEPVTPRVPDGVATFQSTSPARTHALGVSLGKVLQPGDFVGLLGELGAGKTHFVRGLAVGAGVPAGEVSSPTFAIVNAYQGRILLHHADLYRLQGYDDLYSTGLLDLITPESAVVVEWLDRVWRAAPSGLLVVRLGRAPRAKLQSRRLEAAAYGARAVELLNQWGAAAKPGAAKRRSGR